VYTTTYAQRMISSAWNSMTDGSVIPSAPPGRPSQGPRPWRTPEALNPILSGISRPRYAALRLAARRCSRPPLRAGGAALAASKQRPPAEAGGREGGAKMPLVFPIRTPRERIDNSTGNNINWSITVHQ
jgi:hypothetical protein